MQINKKLYFILKYYYYLLTAQLYRNVKFMFLLYKA